MQRPEAVLPAIAKELEVRDSEGVQIGESLQQFLQTKQILLVLDTFEHVSAAGEQVVALLERCPGLRVLMTSRRYLNIIGEENIEVPPLKAPGPGVGAEALSGFDAFQLFIDVAKHADPNFRVDEKSTPAIAAICAELEGIPLAIELAASQIRNFPPQKILKNLHQGRKLTSQAQGLHPRHKAMDATLSWSYDLLDATARALFRCLAVFRGEWTFDSAVGVLTDPDDPHSRELLEKSLGRLIDDHLILRREGDQEYYFRMLDIVREYAIEHLQKVEGKDKCYLQHAKFFLDLAEMAEMKITSAERRDWLDRLDSEQSNLQAAFEWCQTPSGDKELGLRLAGALFWFWNMRGYFAEGRACLESALGWTAGSERSAAYAKALYAAGGLAFLQGDLEPARMKLEESTCVWRRLGNRRGLGYALIIQGMVALAQDDTDKALECETESVAIFQGLRDDWGYALSLNDLGNVFRGRNDRFRSLDLFRQSLKIWRQLNDSWGIPLTLSNLGFLEMLADERAKARRCFEEAAQIQRNEKDRWGLGESLKYLADLAVREEKLAEAERLYRESLVLNRAIGRKPFIVGCLAGLAVLAGKSGRVGHAGRLIGATDSVRGPMRPLAKAIDRGMYVPAVEELSSRFGERFEKARREGQEIDLMQAAAYALERLAT